MSAIAIRAALELALAAMSPSLPTAWQNQKFAPTVGSPYQRVALLFAEPDNPEIGTTTRDHGYMQVSLAYPLDDGTGDADARAELIRQTFYRGKSLVASGIVTTIEKTPAIGIGHVESDRWVIPVQVRFFANYNPVT
jgi:hypothetical protein